MKSKTTWKIFILMLAVATLASASAEAQLLNGEQLKKALPTSYFFAGQSAMVQMRNSAGFKSSGGKLVLAGLVDTGGYATSIAEKYQGFLITETKLTLGNGQATLEPGCYGFGFKDGKLLVMNIAGTDLFSVTTQADDQLKHPVPLKFENAGTSYRLYAGRNYVVVKAD